VRVIFTGRPVTIESLATATSWLNGSLFPPKPPPLGQAMTRMREAGNSSTFVSARCT
jgi:hypothetical protein